MIFTEAQLKEPLRHALSTRTRNTVDRGTPSAVLLPLFELDGQTHIWLLRRADSLRAHAGQVALPGGKRDPGDKTIVDTALREANEEIGLEARALDVLGCLDDMYTHTGFAITPVVAWMTAGFVAIPSAAEVARVFSAPLALFYGKARGAFPRVGHDHDGEFIWGITLFILRGFVDVIRAMEDPAARGPGPFSIK